MPLSAKYPAKYNINIEILLPITAVELIKMCRKTPSLQGWGYKARPPNLRK